MLFGPAGTWLQQRIGFWAFGKYVVTKTAKKLQTTIGILKKVAMLQCLISEGNVMLGEAVCFCKAERANSDCHFCLAGVFRKAPDGWWDGSKLHMFVDSSLVEAMVAYVRDEGGRLFVDLERV